MAASLVSNATALQELGLNIYEAVGFLGDMETAGADSESVISGMKRALKSATEEGVPFDQAMKDLQNTIVNGTGSMDGLTAAYDLFGKSGAGVYQAVKNGQIDFANMAASADILDDSIGSLQSTYEATLDPMDKLKITLNNLKVTGAELGSTILEMLQPAIEKVTEVVQSAKTWWDGLSESQQQQIVKIGMVVAAVGPAVTIIGKVVSGIGSVISIAGSLMSTLGALCSPVGLVVAAIGGLVAGGVALYNHWGELKSWASEKWSSIKETVSGAAESMRSKVSTAWSGIKEKTSSVFGSIKDTIGSKFETAKEGVRTAIDKIKSFFNFSWSLPKIKLPHFSIVGEFNLWPPSIPHISVEWYKKAMGNAMVLDNATIFGAAGGRLLGGGEAGREVVSGESHLLSMIDASVDSALGRRMDTVLALLKQYLPACAQSKVAVPVGAMSKALARDTLRGEGAW